jgi:hypothetical protein
MARHRRNVPRVNPVLVEFIGASVLTRRNIVIFRGHIHISDRTAETFP